MRIIDPGHHYALATLDGDVNQELVFVKRAGHLYPGNVGHHPGVTMQEVIRALIDRCCYVSSQQQCQENALTIRALREALHSLESRAARIHGLTLDVPVDKIELTPPCQTCGHIRCDH